MILDINCWPRAHVDVSASTCTHICIYNTYTHKHIHTMAGLGFIVLFCFLRQGVSNSVAPADLEFTM